MARTTEAMTRSGSGRALKGELASAAAPGGSRDRMYHLPSLLQAGRVLLLIRCTLRRTLDAPADRAGGVVELRQCVTCRLTARERSESSQCHTCSAIRGRNSQRGHELPPEETVEVETVKSLLRNY